eukprot:CAMPEP_0194347466 /NCGR_PEP_ID=MMETSP0171-20130528/106006_1 /TAXON_ID=218684 /ORGANISM="Corethron pennatum, Strain L29A3" /LENGTH=401 /DNA_ID=CAMNT_0039114723 /DNA_START=13 /DNA_END=1217 /DNA_ORIENTATION=+
MKVSKNARQMLTRTYYSGVTGVAQPASAKSMAENRTTKEVVLNKTHKSFFRRALSLRHPFSFRRNCRASSTEGIETTSEESVSDDDIETLPAKRGVSFKPTVAVIRGPSREKIVRIARSGFGNCDVGSTAEAVTTGVRALWWEPEDYALFRDACTILARTEAPDRSSDAEAHTALLAGTTTARDNSEDGCCATAASVSWEDEHDSRSVDDGDDKGWWCAFGHSRRGIDPLPQSALGRQRLAAVAMAKTAVLGEQMWIKMEGTTSSEELEEKLACVLIKHSGDAQDAAHRRGLEDAAAAATGTTRDGGVSSVTRGGGIEHITQSALGRQRVAAAAMAKTAMLGEQMRTKMEGTTTSENLEEKLACVLMEHTGDAQDAAHRRGLEDAAAAAAVCLEDNAFSTI